MTTRLALVHRPANRELQVSLEATGTADYIRANWYEVRRRSSGHFRLVPLADRPAEIDLAHFDRLLADGWSSPRPEFHARFRSAVVAGARHDVFSGVSL